MIRNVQGQTHIKDNFNFVQSIYQSMTDKATLFTAYFAAKKCVQSLENRNSEMLFSLSSDNTMITTNSVKDLIKVS